MNSIVCENQVAEGNVFSSLPLFLLLGLSLVNGGTTPLPTFLIRVGTILVLALCFIRGGFGIPRNFTLPLFFSPPILSYPS